VPRRFITVFLSSTWTDLVEYRRAVSDAIQQSDFHSLSMPFPATGQPPLEVCLGKLDQADLYVGIIGSRYGSSPKGSEKSYTHLEYEHARAKGIPTLIFLMSPECERKCTDLDQGENAERLAKFKEVLGERNTYSTFDSPDHLATRVLASIIASLGLSKSSQPARSRVGLHSLVASCRTFSGSLLDWPRELVTGAWIDRPELRTLQSRVASSNRSLTILLGPPGSGKSALLSQVAQQAADEGQALLAIKADQLPGRIANSHDLAKAIGLPDRVEKCIAVAAQNGPFILVVDQLDALSDLTDLRSGRLNVILDLIRACRNIDGVHIACSCRQFEFRHDIRLNNLDAEEVELKLPSWEQVQVEIGRLGIDGTNWPEKFRTILQMPQHLDVFLRRHQETGQANVFTSYQQMLDDLWARKLRSRTKQELIYQLTERLTRTEELWCPVVVFENRQRLVNSLIADGLLEKDKFRIGFRHQTMLEHARAKLFTKSDKSLAAHALARQNALFVRPMLWATLAYLREADQAKYRSELAALFKAQLRLHMRYLLIDFLGQLEDPDHFEIDLMGRSLEAEDDRARVLFAILGKAGWFRAMRTGRLASVAKWPVDQLWPLVALISAAWVFAKDDCFDLLDREFLLDPRKDLWTYQCLRALPEWDDRAVEFACKIVVRTGPGRTWWVEDLVNTISESAPTQAARVAAKAFEHELGQLTSQDRSPLEDGREWHQLPDVAAASPSDFLREMWPWFVEVVKRYHASPNSSVVNHFAGHTTALNDNDDGVIHYPVAHSIEIAVLRTAKTNPEAFLDVTRSSWEVPLAPIQTLIARGLAEGAVRLCGAALEFLCTDLRRLDLGGHHLSDQFYSCELIRAIATHLDSSAIERLIANIERWSRYRDPDTLEEHQRIWDREARLRLLTAIPEEMCPPDVLTFIEKEKVDLPEWKPTMERGRFGRVHEVPPMPKEEMRNAPDDAIIETLRSPNVDRRQVGEWIESERVWKRTGGREAAVRELREFAKEEPQRCLDLLPKIAEYSDGGATAEIFSAIGETQLPDDRIFDAALALSPGASSEEFRSTVAHVLYSRCRPNVGLPQSICDLLENWLAMPWAEVGFDRQRPRDSNEQSHPESLLFGYSGPQTLDADLSFWVLLALSSGYLRRMPADIDRWLTMLERHVQRPADGRTWTSFSPELRWLATKGVDSARALRIVSKLFENHPTVRDSREGVRLISLVQRLLPFRVWQSVLKELRQSDWERGRQAYGELVALMGLRHQPPQWAVRKLTMQLRNCEAGRGLDSEDTLTGIAFAAAHCWEEPQLRSGCSQVLAKLFAVGSDRISYACSTVFWASHDFLPDEVTENLLNAVADNCARLSDSAISDLIGHLPSILPEKRRTVLKLCNSIVSHVGSKLTSISTGVFTCGPSLVNIAMTLQRFEDTRTNALDLFERLLSLGVDAAFNCLHEIDIRPIAVTHYQPRARRRRRAP
jgi:Domain of unknown function (DUF4062)/ATPase family associated with various cellular activities (AAA)